MLCGQVLVEATQVDQVSNDTVVTIVVMAGVHSTPELLKSIPWETVAMDSYLSRVDVSTSKLQRQLTFLSLLRNFVFYNITIILLYLFLNHI
jgi:hypothetical protein